MRMVWWREVKWLVASWLLGLSLALMEKEMSNEAVRGVVAFLKTLESDVKYNTIVLRSRAIQKP